MNECVYENVNLIDELEEVFTVNENNTICGYECTDELKAFFELHRDTILRYAKQLHWRDVREAKRKKYEDGRLF